jgi:putative flippase GtrA
MNRYFQQAIAEFKTIFRFAIVGVVATLTHMLLALTLLNLGGLPPLPANILAFCVAFFVSFAGHSFWTFRGHGAELKASMVRLLITAGCGFLLNNGTLWLLLVLTALGDDLSVILAALVVPPATYLMNKFWVFRA